MMNHSISTKMPRRHTNGAWCSPWAVPGAIPQVKSPATIQQHVPQWTKVKTFRISTIAESNPLSQQKDIAQDSCQRKEINDVLHEYYMNAMVVRVVGLKQAKTVGRVGVLSTVSQIRPLKFSQQSRTVFLPLAVDDATAVRWLRCSQSDQVLSRLTA